MMGVSHYHKQITVSEWTKASHEVHLILALLVWESRTEPTQRTRKPFRHNRGQSLEQNVIFSKLPQNKECHPKCSWPTSQSKMRVNSAFNSLIWLLFGQQYSQLNISMKIQEPMDLWFYLQPIYYRLHNKKVAKSIVTKGVTNYEIITFWAAVSLFMNSRIWPFTG